MSDTFPFSVGHVQLTYFCSWVDVAESCDREAVSNMYCAPGESFTHATYSNSSNVSFLLYLCMHIFVIVKRFMRG